MPVHLDALATLSRRAGYPLAVYAATRAAGVLFTWLATREQVAMPDARYPGYHSAVPTPAAPDYWTATTNWDGQWYRTVAEEGYPDVLPRTPDGQVVRSSWAFYPLYPMTVRAVMAISAGRYEVVAPVLSTVLGAVAVVLLYRLVLASAEPFVAKATVAAFCCSMAAPILQFAYPESLALLLVMTCLWCLRQARWGWLAVSATLLALTRPLAAPLGAAVLLLAWVPWPGGPSRSTRERWRLTAVGVGIGALSLLWPAIAALRTGRLDAYVATSKAWTPGLGTLLPGPGYLVSLAGPTGLLLFLAAAAVPVALTMGRSAAAWGPQLRAWLLAYPLYLVTMTVPGTSYVRYLLLAGPLFWPFASAVAPQAPTTRRVRSVGLSIALVVGLALQVAWLSGSWRLMGFTP